MRIPAAIAAQDNAISVTLLRLSLLSPIPLIHLTIISVRLCGIRLRLATSLIASKHVLKFVGS